MFYVTHILSKFLIIQHNTILTKSILWTQAQILGFQFIYQLTFFINLHVYVLGGVTSKHWLAFFF